MKPNQQNADKKKNMWVALWPCLGLLLLFLPRSNQSDFTKSMGITQKLGDTVPMTLPFKDEDGKTVKLGDEFQGRPVVLVPIFYSCKTGCAILTDNILKTLAKATRGDILKPGRDMDVVMYSIDPKEDSALAHSKKVLIMNALDPHMADAKAREEYTETAQKGWHLLTGTEESVRQLSTSLGFKYSLRDVPDLENKKVVRLINHPTCTVIATPEGKVSSYTVGNDFQTREVEEDLKVAKGGKISRPADQSMMFGCIMVDPATGKNRIVIENVWRLCGVLTLLVLVGSIVTMSLKSKRENPKYGGASSLR